MDICNGAVRGVGSPTGLSVSLERLEHCQTYTSCIASWFIDVMQCI